MRKFPKFTGYLIPDVFLVHIVSTTIWLAIGYFINGMPDMYPSDEEAKPVLLTTFAIAFIYAFLYWISLSEPNRD